MKKDYFKTIDELESFNEELALANEANRSEWERVAGASLPTSTCDRCAARVTSGMADEDGYTLCYDCYDALYAGKPF